MLRTLNIPDVPCYELDAGGVNWAPSFHFNIREPCYESCAESGQLRGQASMMQKNNISLYYITFCYIILCLSYIT